jgi:hypothetical protein
MLEQKIVAHYLNGTLVKGTTTDFNQARHKFHVVEDGTGDVKEIGIGELKAVFFVNTLEGKQDHIERTDVERKGMGRKIKVQFKDGETMLGYTTGYSPGRPAFFLIPSDPDSNNQRIFILTEGTESVEFI